eukprot:scaffold2446_cov83-Phaeocystis_antarctica.AAC.1
MLAAAKAARAAAVRELSGVLACSDARANQLLELSNNNVQQAAGLHHELGDFDVGPGLDHQRAVSEQAAPQAVPSLKKHCRSPTAILKRKEKRKKLVGIA